MKKLIKYIAEKDLKDLDVLVFGSVLISSAMIWLSTEVMRNGIVIIFKFCITFVIMLLIIWFSSLLISCCLKKLCIRLNTKNRWQDKIDHNIS